MKFPGLLPALEADDALTATLADSRRAGVTQLDVTSVPAFFPLLTAAIAEESSSTVLLVTSTYREAEQLTTELGGLLGDDKVAYYPAWETLPHERLSPRADTVGRRLAVLRRLAGKAAEPVPSVVVAPVRSVLQPQVKGLADMAPVQIAVGERYPLEDLLRDLAGAAYNRVDLVERRGEFAVRGGILDVFPPTAEHPVRIDFFGDDVDEIRPFTVADQRSTGDTATEIVAPPCRELLLTTPVRARARALAAQHPELSDMLTRVAEGHAVEGMEALTPALVDGVELLVDVLPKGSLILASSPELIRARAAELVQTSQEFLEASWAAAAGGGKSPIDLGASAYWALGEVRQHALQQGHRWWSLSPFAAGRNPPSATLMRPIHELSACRPRNRSAATRRLPPGTSAIASRTAGEWCWPSRAVAWRSAWSNSSGRAGSRRQSTISTPPRNPAPSPSSCRRFGQGWRADTAQVEVITEAELTGQVAVDKAERKLPARRKPTIAPLELKAGDPVVHEQHGVGRFVELVSREVQGATRDYLVVEYAPSKRGHPGDRLFVPMDQLDMLSRYVGAESPTHDKMGGADWSQAHPTRCGSASSRTPSPSSRPPIS